MSDHKQKGNEAIARKDYGAAEAHYTKGISASSSPAPTKPADKRALAVLFSNRAQARIFMRKAYQGAVEDCTSAIELCPEFLKSLLRRATANARLGKADLMESDLDALLAVKDAELAANGLERAAIHDMQQELRRDAEAAAAAAAAASSGPGAVVAPNDASPELKRQIAAQVESGAVYVFFMDELTLSVKYLQAVTEHRAAQQQIRKMFGRAVRGEDRSNSLFYLFDALKRGAMIEGPNGQKFQVNEDHVADQLEAEFGEDPRHIHIDHGTDADAPAKTDKPVTQRPPMSVIQTSEADGRYFYPGGPKYLGYKERFYELLQSECPQFKRVTRDEYYNTYVYNVEGQRRGDECMFRLVEAYRGKHDVFLTIGEHRQKYKEAGFDFATSRPDTDRITYSALFREVQPQQGPNPPDLSKPCPRVCDFCDAPLHMDDVPECLCGMPYCSDRCHKADWKAGHADTCQLIEQNGLVALTKFYWYLVQKGALPEPGQPDYVARWKTEGLPNSDGTREAELEFYLATEREDMQERVGKLQDIVRKRQAGPDRIAAAEAQANLLDEIQRQRLRYETPLHCDSLARLGFKSGMAGIYRNMSNAIPMLKQVGSRPVPSEAALSKTFAPFLKRAEKNALPSRGDRPAPKATAAPPPRGRSAVPDQFDDVD